MSKSELEFQLKCNNYGHFDSVQVFYYCEGLGYLKLGIAAGADASVEAIRHEDTYLSLLSSARWI